MEWMKNRTIKVDPPKNPKKCTGTRFAAILGMNKWCTPFETWCAITRTYEKPYEDTIYTIAGNTIEPKQADYIDADYFWRKMLTPTDVYGADYFKATRGDFFPNNDVFGGMWDYLFTDKDGKPDAVLEMKTTKRAEDWLTDIPENYALQAALYAYLLGVDEVIMVCSFLDESDYAHPENYVCSLENTITRTFKMSERYPNFEDDYIKPALDWWDRHVVTGISPIYDEDKDAEVLKALRSNNLNPDTDLNELIGEAEQLKTELDAHAAEIEAKEKRYKKLTELIKESVIPQFRDGDKNVTVNGTKYRWVVNLQSRDTVDKKQMEKDGVLSKYVTTKPMYVLTPKAIKED